METPLFALIVLLTFAVTSCVAGDVHGATDSAPTLPDFDAQWDYANPAATEAKFRDLLANAPPTDNAGYRRALQTQIARAQGLQSHFDEAHRTLDEVEGQIADGATPLAEIRYFLERGRLFNSAGKPEQARPLFLSANALATDKQFWLFAVDAAHMIAIIEPTPSGKIEWNKKTLAIIDQRFETERWRPSIWNNLGEAYRADRQPSAALECFQSIIQWQAANNKPVWRYARVDEAKMLRLVGRREESLERIAGLHQELLAAGERDGVVLEELAENYLAAGEKDAAQPLFAQAWNLLKGEAWLKQSEPERFERLKNLANQ